MKILKMCYSGVLVFFIWHLTPALEKFLNRGRHLGPKKYGNVKLQKFRAKIIDNDDMKL